MKSRCAKSPVNDTDDLTHPDAERFTAARKMDTAAFGFLPHTYCPS